MEGEKKAVPTWKRYNRPWYMKLILGIGNYFKNVGLMLWRVIKAIPRKLWAFVCAIGLCFQGLWLRFRYGDWRTRMSYLIFGFGCFSRGHKQFLKGFCLLAVEVLYVLYMVFLGGFYLGQFGTLGVLGETWELIGGKYQLVQHDHSIRILLFSVMTLMITLFVFYVWIKNTKIAYATQQRVKEGKPLSTAKQQINYALNDGYNVTVLALPVIGILLMSVLPLICNILIAFTNYGLANGVETIPPHQVLDWTGFQAFGDVFGKSYGTVIWSILLWTLIWAFFATFTNFFFGMFLAMMINKKSIKIKVFWRTCFILVIAIPDFITLLLMRKFFSYSSNTTLTGAFNRILQEWFGLNVNVDWFGTSVDQQSITRARVMVILVNMWRGMPYTMLATSGILMNIPAELYESSRIDGAGPVRRFISITFPYIMFVMGPQLITTFTGNINNFNVIYFLTGGGPSTLTGGTRVGGTDLLITWLYSLTVDRQQPEYSHGAVIGIFMFLISSFFALIVFNSSKSNTQEDTFQ